MKSISYIIIILLFLLNLTLIAQPKDSSIDFTSKIPQDTSVIIGHLENGLTYYIRKNSKPEKRAELRLAVNAGSILENDDQQGLAHFAEHMAFNGTKNFKKQEIVNFLESVGMRFGPELNAYTSFDETVYMLQLPTDTAGILEKGFNILEDWAHNVSYENSEIDKERGVVIEEWRQGRGAEARMRDKQLPVIFKDSKYAQRLPIGKKDIIEKFDYDKVKKFYREWYRPELMAVVAVGDFDVRKVEDMIKKEFSQIPKSPASSTERKFFPVPDQKEDLFAIASDKEASRSGVSVYFMRKMEKETTIGDLRKKLIEDLYDLMLNERLYELSQKADPPFLGAGSDHFDICRTKSAYAVSAAVKDNGILQGLESILREVERVKRFGFTVGELDRVKKDLLSQIEQSYNERNKTESANLAGDYVYSYLWNETSSGIENEYYLYNKLIPGVSLEEVNKIAQNEEAISKNNRVIVVNSPEKEGIKVPTEKELSSIFEIVKKENILAYVDTLKNEDLLKPANSEGKIVSENEIRELGITELKLSNGIKVVLKPTDFKNDEIQFTAFSRGGNSLASDDKFISAATATSIVSESGVGKFSQVDLQKMLAGKIVNVNPWISDIQEGFSGSSSTKDIESLFKLVNLYFTSPRKDSSAFKSYLSKMKAYFENRSASPRSALQDTLTVTLSNYHFRYKPWTVETLKKIDLDDAYKFFKDRFSDAGDFTFIFVGNFDLPQIKPFIQTYLGSLPSQGRKENFADIGKKYPTGVIKKIVKKGQEPQSQVVLGFTGPFNWNSQNIYNLSALSGALDIKLREVIREDKGGTYGVSVSRNYSRFPRENYIFSISFGCDPKNAEELTKAVFSQIDSIKKFGIGEIYVKKIKEIQIRTRETELRRNEFWLNNLSSYYFNDIDPKQIFNFDQFVSKLSAKDIQESAQKYLNENNYVKVVLYPENYNGI